MASTDAGRIRGDEGNKQADFDPGNEPVRAERDAVRLDKPKCDRDRDVDRDGSGDRPARLIERRGLDLW
jgi:hypothetical protein